MNRIMTLAALMLLVAGGCKKNNDNTADGGTARSNILTSGSWQITVYHMTTYHSGVKFEFDMLNKLDDCEKDNRYIFNKNGTVITDEGATKCQAGDPQQQQSGTWQLVNNDTQLKSPGSLTDATQEIDELNQTTFKFHFTEKPDGEPEQVYEITMTHIL